MSKQPQEFNDLEKVINQVVSLEVGIVPIESLHTDVGRSLLTLDKDAARAMKRKFRKEWRKSLREIGTLKNDSIAHTPGKAPTRKQKQQRKRIVAEKIYDKRIEPTIKNLTARNKEKNK